MAAKQNKASHPWKRSFHSKDAIEARKRREEILSEQATLKPTWRAKFEERNGPIKNLFSSPSND